MAVTRVQVGSDLAYLAQRRLAAGIHTQQVDRSPDLAATPMAESAIQGSGPFSGSTPATIVLRASPGDTG